VTDTQEVDNSGGVFLLPLPAIQADVAVKIKKTGT
jgi:hypothetical protein